MLIQLIKTLILPRIETVDLEVQGQVQTSPFMPNLNTTLNLHPSSSIKIAIPFYFRVSKSKSSMIMVDYGLGPCRKLA